MLLLDKKSVGALLIENFQRCPNAVQAFCEVLFEAMHELHNDDDSL
jgi:hypothetical protein